MAWSSTWTPRRSRCGWISIRVDDGDPFAELGEEVVHSECGVEFVHGAFAFDDGLEQDGEIGGKYESVAAKHWEQVAKNSAEFDVRQRRVGDRLKECGEIGPSPRRSTARVLRLTARTACPSAALSRPSTATNRCTSALRVSSLMYTTSPTTTPDLVRWKARGRRSDQHG